MIVTGLSSAQLDTIDVEELRQLVTVERVVAGMERFAGAMHSGGIAIAASSARMRAAFVAVVGLMGHRATEIDLDAPPTGKKTVAQALDSPA